VQVGRRVIPEIYPDHDTEEDRDDRHDGAFGALITPPSATAAA
jgi:hypothetical protein